MKSFALPFIAILLAPFFIQSVPVNKINCSYKDSSDVNELLLLPICSSIGFIEKGNQVSESIPLSQLAESEIRTQVLTFMPSHIKKRSVEFDSATESEIYKSGIKLIKTLRNAPVRSRVKAPPHFVNILDSLHELRGLFILQIGFTRSEKNFQSQFVKRRVLNLATLGIYNTIPNESYSAIIGVLINRDTKEIEKYKEVKMRNRDPNEKVVIRQQIRDIIGSFFNQ